MPGLLRLRRGIESIIGRAAGSRFRPASGVVALAYDGKNAIRPDKDPRNITTTDVRNGFGAFIPGTTPDLARTISEYDARGLVTKTTDALSVISIMTFDKAGYRLVRRCSTDTRLRVPLIYGSGASGNRARGRPTSMTEKFGSDPWRRGITLALGRIAVSKDRDRG